MDVDTLNLINYISDGCGFNWIDSLKAYTSTQVSDQQMSEASIRFPVHTPKTKEAYYYRSIFEEYYPGGVKTVPYGDSIACSTPRAIAWDASFKDRIDPSGRTIDAHPAALYKPSSS